VTSGFGGDALLVRRRRQRCEFLPSANRLRRLARGLLLQRNGLREVSILASHLGATFRNLGAKLIRRGIVCRRSGTLGFSQVGLCLHGLVQMKLNLRQRLVLIGRLQLQLSGN